MACQGVTLLLRQADSTTVSDGAVTLTLAAAERLWARERQELLQEFEGMVSFLGTHYEQQLRALLMRLHEFEGMVLSAVSIVECRQP